MWVYICVCVSNHRLRAARYACLHWHGGSSKIKKKLKPTIQCSAVLLYWGLQLCLHPSTPHVFAAIVYCPFFLAIVRAVCLSWLSADFVEQNAYRWMNSNWGVPLIGTYVREQMAESHVTLRCMGIEQGLSLPAYDLLIPHQVSMKRNHHIELHWSIVRMHMVTAAPEPVEWQPNFHRRGLVSIPGCPWCSIMTDKVPPDQVFLRDFGFLMWL